MVPYPSPTCRETAMLFTTLRGGFDKSLAYNTHRDMFVEMYSAADVVTKKKCHAPRRAQASNLEMQG